MSKYDWRDPSAFIEDHGVMWGAIIGAGIGFIFGFYWIGLGAGVLGALLGIIPGALLSAVVLNAPLMLYSLLWIIGLLGIPAAIVFVIVEFWHVR